MAHDEKPLPRPPRTPFGGPRGAGDAPEEPLMADRLAAAQAQGRLEEFLARELPDSPRARDLAAMMLGMTGMAPGAAPAAPPPPGPTSPAPGEAAAGEVPPEVVAAVGSGDVAGLMDALRREHARRRGEAGEAAETVPPPPAPGPEGPPLPAFDRETVEAMLRIAAENGVTPDWVVHRAIKLYVEEHRKTGRL